MGNDTRRLMLSDTDYVFLDQGAYGTVFVDRNIGRIRKVLRRTEKAETHCRAVLQAELDALKIAGANDELSAYIAAPFCELPLLRIIDQAGSDITSEFFPDAGFEAAYIDGQFCKIGSVNAPNWPCLSKAFRAAGILHLSDASVTLDAAGNVVKIIDFATHEIESAWSD